MSHAPRAGTRAARSATILAALALASVAPALADPVRVVATDARGVTLEVAVGAWTLTAADADGRSQVSPLPGSHALGIPGRPTLPAFAVTLALPPDGRPSARVIATSGEQARDGVRLEVAGRPAFRDEGPGGLGIQPTVETVAPIADGPWPSNTLELAKPFGFRGRRLVWLEIRPFRYDEASGRVSSPLTLTVRVDFNRPAGASLLLAGGGLADPHVDGVLEGSVANWNQAQGWRTGSRAAAAGGSLFGRATPPGGASGGASRGAAQALAFDEDQPEVRVKITDTGLYRLAFDNLSTHGYPDQVPVGEVSVHRHEFLENAQPPYATIELPSEVEDANGNGVFDSGDGVWVWVRNWAERSGASYLQRFWGDTEVVYATRKPGGGLRMPQRPGWKNLTGIPQLASYPSFKHYERDAANIMPFVTLPTDTSIGVWQWTDLAFYYNRPDTIHVQTNDLDTTHNASITVRWVGRRADSHFMWAGLRNGLNQITTVVDSVSWFGKTAVVRSATFPGSVLTEGNTNFFRHWGKNGFGPPDQNDNAICFVGLDWFELTYWRRYRAVADYVRFNTADGSDDVQMHVDGFGTDSLRVYDVTDPDQPVRVTIDPAQVSSGAGGFAFDMQDSVAGTRREYVAAALQSPASSTRGPLAPPASAYGDVTRRNLWAANSADYLLVSPEAFLPALPPLHALRASQGRCGRISSKCWTI